MKLRIAAVALILTLIAVGQTTLSIMRWNQGLERDVYVATHFSIVKEVYGVCTTLGNPCNGPERALFRDIMRGGCLTINERTRAFLDDSCVAKVWAANAGLQRRLYTEKK